MAKKTINRVKCIECKHAELMQWDNNPVISKCCHHIYRQVANALRSCTLFEKSMKQKTIKHYTHHVN